MIVAYIDLSLIYVFNKLFNIQSTKCIYFTKQSRYKKNMLNARHCLTMLFRIPVVDDDFGKTCNIVITTSEQKEREQDKREAAVA